MADAFGPIILLFFCLSISYWEYNRFNTIITPFGVLAWPYTIIVIMINWGGGYFGFFPVSLQSVLFVVTCFVFFLIGGQWIISLFVDKKTTSIIISEDNNNIIEKGFEFYRPLFIFLASISIIAGFIHFNQCIKEIGWINIASIEFDKAYGSGPLSHVMILSRLAFIFLFADFLLRKKKYILILLVFLFLIVFARQVKYHIIGLILGGIYFSIFNNLIKLSIKKILSYLFIIFLLFITSYYIGFFAVSTEYAFAKKTQAWLLNLFFAYLFGGPIGFSEILRESTYPIYSLQEIIAVPINIYKFLIGDKNVIDIVIHHRISVSSNFRTYHSTNVYGMIGMLYMYLGSYLTLIYMFVLGSTSYLFWVWALKLRNMIGLQLVNAFIMALLTVGFFDLYFNKLILYEVSFYMLIIPPIYFVGRKTIKFVVSQHEIELSKN